MVTQRFCDFLRPCAVLLRPFTQHYRIASEREMSHVEIQSCIRIFHIYKATVVFSSGVYFLYGPLLFFFVRTSFVTCLLAASIQEEEIRLDKGPWDSVDTDVYSFFF